MTTLLTEYQRNLANVEHSWYLIMLWGTVFVLAVYVLFLVLIALFRAVRTSAIHIIDKTAHFCRRHGSIHPNE